MVRIGSFRSGRANLWISFEYAITTYADYAKMVALIPNTSTMVYIH